MAMQKGLKPSVAPSTDVDVLKKPQLGPYKPMSGSSYVPYVPGNEDKDAEAHQPSYGNHHPSSGHPAESGSAGAPSLPAMNGTLFRKGPADPHYLSEDQGDKDPYKKVNNPKTNGFFTLVKQYVNGIAHSQNVDNAGWKARAAQQRTSVMRVTLPPHGGHFGTETYLPNQMPQQARTQRFLPQTGHGDPGTLNSSTYGAGQTAGGIGGNQYTPQPGPPATTSTADTTTNPSGMPSWG